METDRYIDPQLLADNAAFTTNEEVRYDFSSEEILRMKEQYFVLSNYQDTREEASRIFKALMAEYDSAAILEGIEEIKSMELGNQGLKALKKENKSMLKMINRGYEIRKTKLFAFPYYELGRMAFYDESGKFVYDRTMKPEERQITISTPTIRKLA
ncbi:MAG TPA: hypothetical protein PKM97_13630 [Bacteroidia bacterium]|nr:hypothetical protein [Bacteroidia bacterium]